MALLSATAGAQTFESGHQAYMRGEYARAFEILKPLADKGDAKAAYVVGRQYQLGQGVGRDLGEAWYWYRRAEARGHVEAGLFRHLLVTKWKIADADRVRGEAKFAKLGRKSRRLVSKIQLRPSPRPTQAVALPRSLPRTVTISKLPRIEVQPTPQPAAKRSAPEAAPKTEAPERRPDVAARTETCTSCRTERDTEPDLDDQATERTYSPPDQRRDAADEPTYRRAAPSWQEERYYAAEPPPVAVYPGRRFWRAPRPVWQRPGWRSRARWRRFRPGFARRQRFRGWRRY